jgi:hypothetical protein
MIDRSRIASITGISILILGAVAFGIPAPAIVDNPTSTTGSTTASVSPTNLDVGMTTTGGYMVQDSEAVVITAGAAVVAGAALFAGGAYAGSKLIDSDQSNIDVGGKTAEEVQSSIYASAGTVNQGSDTIYQTTDTLASRGENAIWSEAKVEIVEALDNGTSQSKAKQAAREVVNERYAELERAVLNRMTTISNNIVTTTQEIKQTENLTWENAMYVEQGGQKYSLNDGFSDNISGSGAGNSSYTLQTGEEYTYTEIAVINSYSNELWNLDDNTIGDISIYSKPVDSELNKSLIVKDTKFTSLLDDIDTAASDLRTNVETYASDIYGNYSAGEVNASDFLTASDVAQNYNLESQNGTAYSTASAALLGYETNAETSMTIEYVDTGATVSGNLFSTDGAPTTYDLTTNNTTTTKEAWIPNHTYDVSAYSGDIYLASGDEWTNVDSDFEIVDLEQATTGADLEYAGDQVYSTVDTDATNLSRSLADLNAAIDNRTTTSSGFFGGGLFGGDGFIPGIPGGTAIHVLILIAGGYLFVAATRD